MFENPWSGVFAATLCPFNNDYTIDEAGLRDYVRYIAGVDGIRGLVCNGHTGEVMGLTARERVKVTEIIADEVGDRVKVISGICCEGSFEAIEHSKDVKAAGADAILLMPCHHWLRFGRTPETAIGYFEDVANGADISIILHQYPQWCKATYTLKELSAIGKIPQVKAFKIGTRDFGRIEHEYRMLKQELPDVPHLSCHDEYLLSSILAGADGVLVGFAGFVPELIVALTRAAIGGDLAEANRVQELIYKLNKMVYRFGEPSSDAHQRMKVAMTLQGRFPGMTVRPPLRPLSDAEMARIRQEVAETPYELAMA